MIRVGESAYLLELANEDGRIAAYRRLSSNPPDRLTDLVPGARTLLVVFAEPARASDEAELREIERISAAADLDTQSSSRRHEIPVRYDGEDLAQVALRAGLSIDEAIALHASIEYRVAFLGFQPGFAYLAGLPSVLATPRRASPRPRVAAGSVAIGGEWTGIYPFASPGGWNLIGRTEVTLFRPQEFPPTCLTMADRVRFVPR